MHRACTGLHEVLCRCIMASRYSYGIRECVSEWVSNCTFPWTLLLLLALFNSDVLVLLNPIIFNLLYYILLLYLRSHFVV